MKLGVYLRLLGRPGTSPPPPGWTSIRAGAVAAEAAGFDLIVMEDALLYPDDGGNVGVWDPLTMAAAVASTTERIGISHAVLNNPYRHPAITARAAVTLDEISGGRYTLGIGSGNTPDDYPRFGIAADRRYSRLAESIQVIRALVRGETARLDGEFYSVPEGALVLRGPRPGGPPISVSAGKPRMLRLAARYADEWNWWATDPADPEAMGDVLAELDRACDEVDRDPSTLRKTIDLFSITPPAAIRQADPGTARAIADQILAWGRRGFDDVRIDLRLDDSSSPAEGIARMADVVRLVHAA